MESIFYWKNSFQENFSKKCINLTQIEIWKSVFERKQIGMERLKLWDDISKSNIQMIKALVDSLFVALDSKLNDSFERYEKVYKFFSQIKMTFLSRLKFSKEPDLFQSQNDDSVDSRSQSEFCSFFDFVKTFEDDLETFQDQINSHKNEVQKNINQRIMSEKVKQKELRIKELYAEVKELKLKLQKMSMLTSNKLKNLMKAFKEYFVDANKNKRPSINIFEFVFAFMNHVRDLSDMIKRYGSLFVTLYEESLELERERLEAMGESFSFFFKIIRVNYSQELFNKFQSSVDLLGKMNNNNLIETNYNIEKILDEEQSRLVKATLESEVINISVIGEFIKRSKYEESIKEILEHFVLKIYKVQEVGQKSDSHRPAFLFLTIDYFYTIYTVNVDTNDYEFLTRFPIEETELLFTEHNTVSFSFYERNFLWKSKKKVVIRFLIDCKEELLLDHETFSLLLKTADITDDSQSTRLHNKSFDGTQDLSGGVDSPDTSPEKALKEDSKIEKNMKKLIAGIKTVFTPKLEKIEEEKEEECFTDERSAEVDSRFSNDDLNPSLNKVNSSLLDKKSREI